MTDQLPDQRAEQAARDWFAQQAAATAPAPIDPAIVREATGSRQRRRFTLLAAAAAVLAVLVIIPLALRPAAPITGVPAPTGPVWTTTAPSPLSPRFGSLTAWLDGRFYIIGGWDGGPCPPRSACDMPGPDLRDGAHYDPATDSWTRIAEAPFAAGRDWASVAAVAGVLYVRSASGDDWTTWAYQPDRDQWRQLTDGLPGGSLVGTSSRLFLNTYDGDPVHYAYDAAADTWTALPAGPLAGCGSQLLAAGERLLAVAGCGAKGAEVRTSFFDPAAQSWSEPLTVPEASNDPTSAQAVSNPVYAAGGLVWPESLSSPTARGIFDLAAGKWRQVEAPGAVGPLAYPAYPRWGGEDPTPHVVLTGAGLVAAHGQLLDVRSGRWLAVPQDPVPDRWDPVVSAGPDSLLSCFGYRYADDGFHYGSGSFAEGCYLLTLSQQPASPEPTVPAPSGWLRVTPPDAEPRQDPLLAYAAGSYYLMGGWRSDPSGDDIQLRTAFRLDPATSSWQPIADLPQVALSNPYRMAADVVGSTVYVHFGFEELGELWAYDTIADSWRKVAGTDETERFVSTEDGLFRIRSADDDRAPLALQRLEGDSWVDAATTGTSPVQNIGQVVALDDHHLAWVANQVTVLDTTSMTWAEPVTRPAATALPELEPEAVGGAGALVLVYKTNRDSATPASLEVFTLVNGQWKLRPASTAPGGLNWFAAGPNAGRWVVVHGNLLDPVTGQWQTVPAIPGSDGGWEPVWVAGGEPGVLTCFPKDATDDAGQVPNCYLYRPAGDPVPTTPTATQAAWRTIAPPDPEPRRDPLVVYAAGSYYLMGGWRSDADWNDEQLRTAYRLDRQDGSWRPIAELPVPGLSTPYTMVADVVGPTVYVHFRFEELGELWTYDTRADTWTKLFNTGETEQYLPTADGLFRLFPAGQAGGAPSLQLRVADRWQELPAPPVTVPEWGATMFGVDAHHLGLVTPQREGDDAPQYRVTQFDTASRTWGTPSEPGDAVELYPFGVDGRIVFARPPDTDGIATPDLLVGLKVTTLRDGRWVTHATPAHAGGLGTFAVAAAGPRLVAGGNLFDPATGSWLQVPALPGSDGTWQSKRLAGDPAGILTCYPTDLHDDPQATCAYLDVAG